MSTELTQEDVYRDAIKGCMGLSPTSHEYAHVMEAISKRLRSLPEYPAYRLSPLAAQYDALLAAWPGLRADTSPPSHWKR